MYRIVIKIKQHEHMYPALLGDHAYSFLSSKSGSEGSFFPYLPLGWFIFYLRKDGWFPKYVLQEPKSVMGNMKMCLGVSRHILQGAHGL